VKLNNRIGVRTLNKQSRQPLTVDAPNWLRERFSHTKRACHVKVQDPQPQCITSLPAALALDGLRPPVKGPPNSPKPTRLSRSVRRESNTSRNQPSFLYQNLDLFPDKRLFLRTRFWGPVVVLLFPFYGIQQSVYPRGFLKRPPTNIHYLPYSEVIRLTTQSMQAQHGTSSLSLVQRLHPYLL
jgi:hypothetical protein